MPKTISEIIDELKVLPRNAANISQAKDLIRSLGKIALIEFTLHPNHTITRARLDGGLKNVSEFSYYLSPEKAKREFQRANTPDNAMFYGCIVPAYYSLEGARAVTTMECSKLVKNDNIKSGCEKISFGRWKVNSNIRLVAIVQNPGYNTSENPYVKELNSHFENMVKGDPSIENDIKLISTFFAEEFAKQEINDQYDYFLSAIFAEVMCEYGFDGVMYPSVQADGKYAMNVAIKPETVNSMNMEVAVDCTLYKDDEKHSRIIPFQEGIVDSNGKIKYKDVKR